jgi:predicted dehydrogenase
MTQHQPHDVDRRTFLASAGGGLAAGGLAQAAAGQTEDAAAQRQLQLENPQIGQPVSQTAKAQDGSPVVPKPPPEKVGYCIVGLGKFAVGQILPAFAQCEHSRPVALVSGDRDKAVAVANRYGVSSEKLYNYENYDEIGDNPEIDVVYIILPNALHAEYTIRAHQAGKHVLCEKPMATSVEDCQKMIDAAKQADRKLMIAYRVQYEPYNQKAIEWCREEKYGPIRSIVSDTVLDVGGPNQWRLDKRLAGGGSLMDIGIYSLNATRYLTGQEPVAVSAMQHQDTSDPRFSEVEQTILFQLRFPGGVLAQCSSSYSTHTLNRYHVACRDGWFKLDPATTYTGHRFFHGTKDSEEQLFLPHVSHFAAEMDHLSQAIKNGESVKTPGEEGLNDVKYMQLIYEAARTGKTIEVG